MKNEKFCIEIDNNTGFIKSIINTEDIYRMNWCAEGGRWGKPLQRNWCANTGEWEEIEEKKMKLVSLTQTVSRSKAIYENGRFTVTVTRYFRDNGNFVENYCIKNSTDTVLCVNRDNFGIELPFNDRYLSAEECMVHHCNTHIWCGHNIAWVNALKMGKSNINLGLYLTKGAIDCYDQNECDDRNPWSGNIRGIFVFEPESVMLLSGEEYQIEWELFWHEGKEDFAAQITSFDGFIEINAAHYTVFGDEEIDFNIKTVSGNMPIVKCDDKNIPVEKTNDGYRVLCKMPVGEYRFVITVNGISTWADFAVKPSFRSLLEKRINFIIDNQQCRDPKSPLYGAFLVYDNDYDSMYFDYASPDHNACRERMNMALLLMKYLQIKDDPKVREAVELYIKFVFREFYDEKTGEVFNTIGKNRDQLRLYNAPGVMQIFCEMYLVSGDEAYLKHIMKLAENYYGIGGEKCYANGLTIGKIIRAFKLAGNEENTATMISYFQKHVDNIMGNGTDYPKHEVNYEQTIVTAAVNYISEIGTLKEAKEQYVIEAEKHIENLERFSGMQPSFHLNEIAIRYWDDCWFGKNGVAGDTLPHHLSCLTARAYQSYSLLSEKKEWMARAEECIRNCMCLIRDNGRGAAAYVYPYKLNGKRGEFYDPWSNDQDLVLYDALYFSDYADVFKI